MASERETYLVFFRIDLVFLIYYGLLISSFDWHSFDYFARNYEALMMIKGSETLSG